MIEGLFLSGLLYKYTAMDITRAFIAAAVLFVVLAVMGTSTKKIFLESDDRHWLL